MDLSRKLSILADAAKYDASCASSGKADSAVSKAAGGPVAWGICHSYTPDGRCVSLLRLLLTNFCVYDCQYCVNRRSSDIPRARFSVDEVVRLTLEFYRRNYIEGLFLSSGIVRSPDYTMEQLVLVAKTLRTEHEFRGYIHLKTIPDADEALIAEAGRWADRLSVNIELPTEASLARLAPEKTVQPIKLAMARIRRRGEEAEDPRGAVRTGRPDHAAHRRRRRRRRPHHPRPHRIPLRRLPHPPRLLLGLQPYAEALARAPRGRAAARARAPPLPGRHADALLRLLRRRAAAARRPPRPRARPEACLGARAPRALPGRREHRRARDPGARARPRRENRRSAAQGARAPAPALRRPRAPALQPRQGASLHHCRRLPPRTSFAVAAPPRAAQLGLF